MEQRAELTKRGCPSIVSTAMPIGLEPNDSRKRSLSGAGVIAGPVIRHVYSTSCSLPAMRMRRVRVYRRGLAGGEAGWEGALIVKSSFFSTDSVAASGFFTFHITA